MVSEACPTNPREASGHDPEAVHATAHEELWIEFVEEAVERTDNPELMETPGLSKAEFAEKIRTLE
mgnify:CR=1 FL=1|jgi:hypothetical protein